MPIKPKNEQRTYLRNFAIAVLLLWVWFKFRDYEVANGLLEPGHFDGLYTAGPLVIYAIHFCLLAVTAMMGIPALFYFVLRFSGIKKE